MGCLSYAPKLDETHNPGLCPDRESNRQPFGTQDDAQSTEPLQPAQLLRIVHIESPAIHQLQFRLSYYSCIGSYGSFCLCVSTLVSCDSSYVPVSPAYGF